MQNSKFYCKGSYGICGHLAPAGDLLGHKWRGPVELTGWGGQDLRVLGEAAQAVHSSPLCTTVLVRGGNKKELSTVHHSVLQAPLLLNG